MSEAYKLVPTYSHLDSIVDRDVKPERHQLVHQLASVAVRTMCL